MHINTTKNIIQYFGKKFKAKQNHILETKTEFNLLLEEVSETFVFVRYKRKGHCLPSKLFCLVMAVQKCKKIYNMQIDTEHMLVLEKFEKDKSKELAACDEFAISVAFITMSGITPILQTLKELEKKGVTGRIMTTDYLMVSEPKALGKLTADYRRV